MSAPDGISTRAADHCTIAWVGGVV
jgi:hypothetical protein